MTSANEWRAEKLARRRSSITDLNRATSAAYHACHGIHTPSGEMVLRDHGLGQIAMPVCARCGVPYGKRRMWNGIIAP